MRNQPARKKPTVLKRKTVIVYNYTHYDSADLARMMKAAQVENEETRRTTLTVKYHRSKDKGWSGCSGFAWLGGTSITLHMPRRPVSEEKKTFAVHADQAVSGKRTNTVAADCARVLEHELRHNLGDYHTGTPTGGVRLMADAINRCKQAIPWAVGLPLSWVPPVKKKRATGVEYAEKKHAEALRRVESHENEIEKLKAAIARKKKLASEWRKKARYHARRAAAMRSGQ